MKVDLFLHNSYIANIFEVIDEGFDTDEVDIRYDVIGFIQNENTIHLKVLRISRKLFQDEDSKTDNIYLRSESVIMFTFRTRDVEELVQTSPTGTGDLEIIDAKVLQDNTVVKAMKKTLTADETLKPEDYQNFISPIKEEDFINKLVAISIA